MKHQSHGAVTGLGIIRPIREIRVPDVDSNKRDATRATPRIASLKTVEDQQPDTFSSAPVELCNPGAAGPIPVGLTA